MVLGPNADNKIAVLGNYNGIPSKVVTVLEGIKENWVVIQKWCMKRLSILPMIRCWFIKISHLYITTMENQAFKAEYFDNEKMEGKPVLTLIEKEINHHWPEGEIPYPGLKSTHYSARYTTTFTARKMKF